MKINYQSYIILFLFVLTFFSKASRIYTPIGDIDIIAYPILFVFFLFTRLSYKTYLRIFLVILLILIINIIVKLYLEYDLFPLIKQIIPLVIIYVASYSYLQKIDLKKIFKIYAKTAFYISVLGYFQFILFIFGITFGIPDTHIIEISGIKLVRLSSIITEPSHYCILIVPAFIYYLKYKGLFNYYSLTILLSIILTFSLTGIFTIMITLIYENVRASNWRTILKIPVLILLIYISYLSVYEIKYRVDDLIKYWNVEPRKLNDANLTTISVRSNFDVVNYSLKKSPLFGVGLGGHQESYVKAFEKVKLRGENINAESGHSLWLRLTSETGLIGLLLFISFIYKFYIKDEKEDLHFISLACFSYFVGRLFKLGGYFDYGIYFFLISYFLIYVNYKKENSDS